MDTNREIDSNTILVGDFNTPLTSIDRYSGQKKSTKETATFSDTMDWMNLVGIYKTFFPEHNIHSSQVHMENSQR